MLLGQAAQIDDSIPHTAKSSIDAHTCTLSNLLEIQLTIVAQDDNTALLRRQHFDQLADIGAGLFFHYLLLHIVVVNPKRIDDITVRTVGDNRHLAQTAEVVHNQIMGYAHYPMDELVLILVVARIDCIYHFVKGILKDIVSDILVLDYRENVAIDFALVP